VEVALKEGSGRRRSTAARPAKSGGKADLPCSRVTAVGPATTEVAPSDAPETGIEAARSGLSAYNLESASTAGALKRVRRVSRIASNAEQLHRQLKSPGCFLGPELPQPRADNAAAASTSTAQVTRLATTWKGRPLPTSDVTTSNDAWAWASLQPCSRGAAGHSKAPFAACTGVGQDMAERAGGPGPPKDRRLRVLTMTNK
jgi:hypothetical protein